MINPGDHIGSSVNALVNEYNALAHNMANVNTAGYKRYVSMFSRHLAELTGDRGDNDVPVGEIKSEGAIDFSQGSLINTGRPLDAAIGGKGFFVIETPEGPLYTRNGVFHVNSAGRLVDVSGRTVAGLDAPINIPRGVSESSINIAEDGTINAGGAALGRLRVVDFGTDENNLVPAGDNCFLAPQNVNAPPATEFAIRQGYQENSNVKLVNELVDLISVSRLYETNMGLLRKRHENGKTIIGVANS